MSENEFERRLLWRPAIRPRTIETTVGTYLEPAVANKQQPKSEHGWRKRVSPDFGRAYSAGRLLFQVVGVTGYAGYFVSMHTLMRVFSATLMAGAWYAIFRIKGATRP